MSTAPAVRRLHNDLHRLHVARRERQNAGQEYRKDKHELKADRRHVQHVRDAFVDNRKDAKAERKDLGKIRETRSDRLGDLADKRADLQARYDATVDPLTGQGDPKLQMELAALDQRTAGVRDGFDERIASKRADLDKLQGGMDRQRKEISQTRKDIKHEKKEVKNEKQVLERKIDRQQAARGRAMHDLRPAEYHMSLKGTNRVRRDLNLKPVDHVIRDTAHGSSKLAANARAVAMGMGGYTSGGRCATGVSEALRRTYGISVGGDGNDIDNNLPRDKFKRVNISLAEALKIPGCILTWEKTSTPLGSIYGHTAITTGDGHTSCSDFIETNTTSSGRYGLKIFMPR